MTKADLVAKLMTQMAMKREQAEDIVEEVLEAIKTALEAGEDVKITGFGKWEIQDKDARKGRNPQTGEDIVISERKIVSFKASKILKDRL